MSKKRRLFSEPARTTYPTSMPYVISYDICEVKRARQVLKALSRWRADGQLSVHEVWLTQHEALNLAVELTELVDRKLDKLLFCRLSRYHQTPVISPGIVLINPKASQPLTPWQQLKFSQGSYLLAYDVRSPERLQRIQRLLAKSAVYLQRSVYLIEGGDREIKNILQDITGAFDEKSDDLRLYPFKNNRDLWFLSGALPALPHLIALDSIEHLPKPSIWQKLKQWFTGASHG